TQPTNTHHDETPAPVINLHKTTPDMTNGQSPPRKTHYQQPVTADRYDARDEAIERYPFMSFHINRDHMVGKGVVAPTEESRLRALLHALQDRWKEAPELSVPQLNTVYGRILALEKVKVAITPKTEATVEVSRGSLHEI